MSLFGNYILLPKDQIGGPHLAPIDIEEQEVGHSQKQILNVLGTKDWFEPRNSRFGKRAKLNPTNEVCEIVSLSI